MTRPFVAAIDLVGGSATAGCGCVHARDIWVVGNVRIDARSELRRALGQTVDAGGDGAAGLALVADAYRAWGDGCVERLLGDFSFAVWDAARQRVFIARDHLGVRPMYYAASSRGIVCGDTLVGVRRHLGRATRLDEIAIGDFLVFDAPADQTRTVFADVRRLAAAHALSVEASREPLLRRYWSLPVDDPLRLARMDDYTEQFRQLLRSAVADRSVPGGVGVFMSGGIDSTTLAATAAAIDSNVQAFVWAEDAVDGGEERRVASAAATHLGIAVDVHEPDAAPVAWDWETTPVREVEPTEQAWRIEALRAYYRRIGHQRAVFFHGEGPDNALYYEWRPYVRNLLRNRRFGDLAADACRYAATLRRVPLLDAVAAVGRRGRRAAARYPPWLNSAFERRVRLRDRWRDQPREPTARHPLRPAAYASLQSPLWQTLFSAYDPERTGARLDVRHPFLDLRVLRFMLSVPVVPWCRDKYLLRRAMRDALPRAVVARRKRGRPATDRDRVERRLASMPTPAIDAFRTYVDVERLASAPLLDRGDVGAVLRAKSLNRWLADLEEIQ